MDEFNEIESVRRLIAGSEEAFNEIFYHYEGYVLRESLKRLGPNRQDAEDVVQEVFIKVWHNREKLEPGGKVFNYIYTIMHNACINKIAKNKVRQKYLDEKLGDLDNKMITPSAENKELAEILHNAIEHITSPVKRNIIRRYVVDGEDYESLARETGMKNQTLRNFVSEGLKTMRKFLKNQL